MTVRWFVAVLLGGAIGLGGAATAEAAPDVPTTSAATTSAATSATTSAATSAATTTSAAATTSGSTSGSATTGAGTTKAADDDAITCDDDPGTDYPVVCLPADLDEDEAATLAAGDSIGFLAAVVNHGSVPAADAEVVIDLPAGLRLADADALGLNGPVLRFESYDELDGDGTALVCDDTTTARVTCHTGPVAAGSAFLVGIVLTAQPDAQVGTRASFTVTLQPTAPTAPAAFAPSSVTGTVEFTGTAHLSLSLSPTKATVTVGDTVRVKATVTNEGPDAAPNTFGIALDGGREGEEAHFRVTNAPIPIDDGGDGGESGGASASAPVPVVGVASRPHIRTLRAADNPYFTGGIWPIGTIAAGETESVTIELKARSAGTDELYFFATADVEDPTCDIDDGDGGDGDGAAPSVSAGPGVDDECGAATATLRAVRAAAASSTAAGPAGHRDAPLAASGPTQVAPELFGGLLAVVLGTVLTVAGSRRRLVAGGAPRPDGRHRRH
ncbi:hypothetical protein [Jatrophihabitans endophyticus]|uniref:hypothetical protein n=1 Tax=Jatrophihabitans endophyticus TaxID=1206085 RepID=UPI0013563ECE|nr:hypothetical protein [Jatrophihabitans endophyticus]